MFAMNRILNTREGINELVRTKRNASRTSSSKCSTPFLIKSRFVTSASNSSSENAASSNSSNSINTSSIKNKTLKCRDSNEGIDIGTIGIGTLQWGDSKAGFGETFRENDLMNVYAQAREANIKFFDTAEIYGYQNTKFEQSSEHILSRCIRNEEEGSVKNEKECVLGSKVFTIPWTNALLGGGFRIGKDSLVTAGKESVRRMGGRQMDLWSIHFPFPSFSQDVLCSALEEALDLGLTKAVGVSNYDKEQLEKAYDILSKRGIPLACNQIEHSILNRKAEKSGLLQSCFDRDVVVVAYSPLKALKTKDIEQKYVIMNKLCDFIGQTCSGGKSTVAVQLNYCMAKGCVPIPGVKKADQIKDIEAAMGWTLDAESLCTIDEKMDYLDGLK
jgi:aryl-alcohol dehydrogenase-like predicted oxidoreductase